MQQQINLLQPPLTQPRQVLSLSHLMFGVVGLIAVLGLISAAQVWQTRQLADQQVQLKQKHAAINEAVQALKEKLAAREPDPALKAQLARVDAELQRKQEVLDTIQGRRFGNSEGFAPIFVGLARQRLEGLWLTGLHLSGGGRALDLQGRTLDPTLLPRYLQRLREEPSLQGMQFETFLMQRPAPDSRHIDFDLKSTAQSDTERGARS